MSQIRTSSGQAHPISPSSPQAPLKSNPPQASTAVNTIPQNTPPLKQDQLQTQTTAADQPIIPRINLFDSETDPAPQKGWKVKSVHMNVGYVLDNNVVHTGPMHLKNAEKGSDLTISDYDQVDRKNWEYLKIEKGQRFAPDEPQFNLGVNVTFANNFGIEVDAKHNKIIMDGYDQTVTVDGTFNGEAIHGEMPLNTVMQQHEQTLGNLQLSALATHTFELPAPANHRFSFISKAGPSLITSNTRSQIREPNGEFAGGTNKIELVGYGATVENGLRYQFGPRVGQLGLEFTHALSYLNYANYNMVNGYSGSHDAVYNAFTLKATIGLHGNK